MASCCQEFSTISTTNTAVTKKHWLPTSHALTHNCPQERRHSMASIGIGVLDKNIVTRYRQTKLNTKKHEQTPMKWTEALFVPQTDRHREREHTANAKKKMGKLLAILYMSHSCCYHILEQDYENGNDDYNWYDRGKFLCPILQFAFLPPWSVTDEVGKLYQNFNCFFRCDFYVFLQYFWYINNIYSL